VKIVLSIIGIVLAVAGLVPIVLIVEMIQHPGGIGMEWIAVPIVGVIALGLFGGAFACFYIANRLRPKPSSR